MFSLDTPIILNPMPQSGGNGGFPPVQNNRPLANPSQGPGKPAPKPKAAKASPSPVQAAPVRTYPKPAAWKERRIALCERHHARFLTWKAAESAKLQSWREAQPGYDRSKALQDAYTAKLRQAVRERLALRQAA